MKKQAVVVLGLGVSCILPTGVAHATADSFITTNWDAPGMNTAPTYTIYSQQRSDAFHNDSIVVHVSTTDKGSGTSIFVKTVECNSSADTSQAVGIAKGGSGTINMVSSTGCFRLAMTATGTTTLTHATGTVRYQI